jgi:hypothetical protein
MCRPCFRLAYFHLHMRQGHCQALESSVSCNSLKHVSPFLSSIHTPYGPLQVTRSVDMADGELSPQEQATVNSIVNASNYPLSIVLVGVGDGPWDMMKEFDDNLPQRRFDNFQFVEFNRVMAKSSDPFVREAQFALTALMEIPSQYKAAMELGLLG